MRKNPLKLVSYDAHQSDYNTLPDTNISTTLASVLDDVRTRIGIESQAEITADDLIKHVDEAAEGLGIALNAIDKNILCAQLEKERQPFGVLQPLVDDQDISDIIVKDYANVSFQIHRKNYESDIRFPSEEAYEAFVEKILHRAGTTYSTSKPGADGMIGSFARIHAVHKCVCETGPYLTIRLNRFSTVAVEDIAKKGAAPQAVFDYLLGAVEAGKTILFAGEVGTGKTTLIRALAATIDPHDSIIVIEDTPEIRLTHPMTRYVTTREANAEGEGVVLPAVTIKWGLRMAMNRIIFGEMRDSTAAEAFIDVCASGHSGMSTIHGRSAEDALFRLGLFLRREQPKASKETINGQVTSAVQIVVHLDVCPHTDRRRIMEVREVTPSTGDVIRQRPIFKYVYKDNQPMWKIENKVSAYKEDMDLLGCYRPFNNLGNYIGLSEDQGD